MSRTQPTKRTLVRANVDEAIVLTLFDLANHLQRGGEALAATARLTTQQWLALLQIAGDPNFPSRGPAMLASEIARARGVSRATLSVQLAALRRRGLIEEKADPLDARRRVLAMTDAGCEVVATIEPARRAANQRLLAHLDKRDRARFLGYLRGCLDVLWALRDTEDAGVSAGSSSPRRTPSSPRRRPGR